MLLKWKTLLVLFAFVSAGFTASGPILVRAEQSKPVAEFTYYPITPTVCKNITFDASASYDPDGQIISYSWVFGDGSTGTNVTATHHFTKPDNYTVHLTVLDDQREIGTCRKNVTVLSSEPIVSVDPPSTVDVGLAPSSMFVVHIDIVDVRDIASFEFQLFYNSTILNAEEVLPGPVVPASKITETIDNTAGIVAVTVIFVHPSDAFTGSGTLMTINFNITGTGACRLDLDNVRLGDSTATPISHDAVDGFFSNIGPIICIAPSSIVDPALKAGTSFQVEISILNVTDLHGFEVKMTYNTTILDADEVTWGSFLPSFGSTCNITRINDAAGIVEIAIALYDTTTNAKGSGTLAAINFTVADLGNCTLDLHSTRIIDSNATSVSHITRNGYFDNRMPVAKVAVEPQIIVDPGLHYGRDFTVNVTISNAHALKAFQFRLRYDPTFLEAIEIVDGGFLAQPRWSTTEIEKEQGAIKMTSQASAETTGNGTLASIAFKVVGIGECMLDLSIIELSAQNTYEKVDGYFCNKLLTIDGYTQRSSLGSLQPSNGTFVPGEKVDITALVNYKLLGVNVTFLVMNPTESAILAEIQTTTNGRATTSLHLPVSVVAGNYTVDVRATVFEQSVKNTTMFKILAHDVAIISVQPSEAYAGKVVNISVVVRNEGTWTETFNVSLSCNNTSLGRQTVTLAPGAAATLTFSWATGMTPNVFYTVTAKIDTVTDEKDTADNTFAALTKVKMIGDLNGDSTVDILDIVVVARAFGSLPGDTRWNVEADLTKDGLVNILDIVLVAKDFGKKA